MIVRQIKSSVKFSLLLVILFSILNFQSISFLKHLFSIHIYSSFPFPISIYFHISNFLKSENNHSCIISVFLNTIRSLD